MSSFVGREEELDKLGGLLAKRSSSLVVIRGRRRVGKSRLIREFGHSAPCYVFSGRPPTKDTTKQDELDSFCEQMARLFAIPEFKVDSWGKALWLLSQQCTSGQMIIALDEISWFASKDPLFLGELKNAWDLYFSKNPKLVLIVCGSVSSWIEENILAHTGFVGRISLDLHLKELSLAEAADFWGARRQRLSPYELFKVLSVTGGIPRYLEEVDPRLSAEKNIHATCFEPEGLLFREYHQIFSDLFFKQATRYTEILDLLSHGPKSHEDLTALLNTVSGGHVTRHLRNLLLAGFVSEHPTWDLSSGRPSRLKRYRLSDNYARFYLRAVRPHENGITGGLYKHMSLANLPGIDTILGLQFENLVINNALALLPQLKLSASEVLQFGPFFQHKTKRQKGCQIDLMIQTRSKTLYPCEIKYSQVSVGMKAAEQILTQQEKISRPKGYSMRPVLIHIGGVTKELEDSQAFDHIIEFSSLIQ